VISDIQVGLEGKGQASARERRPAEHRGEEFLALLSHELRTPLHALLGWVRLLQRDVAMEVRNRAIVSIDRNARAMCQIVDDIADQSRISSGKLRLSLDVVDVQTLVRDAADAIRPSALERDVQVEMRAPSALPVIRADRGRLRQVLANLLTNAVKFTPAGGRVELEAHAVAEGVRLVVSDTGCGIAPELLPHIFVRFHQGKDALARAQGLGLGLPLVKELVERHGGRVNAESEGVGRGARFIITLPLSAGKSPGSPGGGEGHEDSVCNGSAAEE
jgi:signal transduction histidine kinase